MDGPQAKRPPRAQAQVQAQAQVEVDRPVGDDGRPVRNQSIGPTTGSVNTINSQSALLAGVWFLLRAMLISAPMNIAAQIMPAIMTMPSQAVGTIGFTLSDPANNSNFHSPNFESRPAFPVGCRRQGQPYRWPRPGHSHGRAGEASASGEVPRG